MQAARDITSYRRYWAERLGTAPFLPVSRAEMEELGWDSCDIVIGGHGRGRERSQ
ncbi:MAG: hypothetical protein ACREUT_18285 [Steroidobacteraceae bacterium]